MRSRNIKPGFFENEKLADLPALTRILYIGLWCYADREGRFEWRPKRIKAVILPYDECNIDDMLMSLHAVSFIDMYDTPNGTVGFIPKFKEHQNPHPHEAKSKLLAKDELSQRHDMQLHVSDMSVGCTADIRIPDSLIPDSKDMCVPVEKKSAYPIEFEAAWKLYPKKTNKGAALKAWKQAVKRDMPVADMPRHIESRMFEPDWRKEDGRFVPHFSTWLNADGWLDEGAAITPPQDDNEPTYGLDFYEGVPEHMRPKPPKPKTVLS